jgi:hypothetical protein
MTKGIGELMALAETFRDAQWPDCLDDKKALRAALEAALNPGEAFGYVNTSTGQFFRNVEDCRKNNEGHWRTVYTTAPPAQTPPTHLSLGGLDEIYRESFGLIDSRLVGDQINFARAIETAVRRQFGVNDE